MSENLQRQAEQSDAPQPAETNDDDWWTEKLKRTYRFWVSD